MQKNLMAYGRYQLTDYLIHKALLPTVLIALMAGVPLYVAIHADAQNQFLTPNGPQFAAALFNGTITLFLPLGLFLAVAGTISGDRVKGYYRFLFSKPVNVVSYYVQQFVLSGVAYVVLYALIVWIFGLFTVHQSVHRAVENALLTYFVMGSLGMLLGALTRSDGVLLGGVWALALLLQPLAILPSNPLPYWATVLAKLLPPVEKLDSIRTQIYTMQPVDTHSLWIVLAYGALMFAAGLIVLRRAPLSR